MGPASGLQTLHLLPKKLRSVIAGGFMRKAVAGLT